jgi:hypothetical protein
MHYDLNIGQTCPLGIPICVFGDRTFLDWAKMCVGMLGSMNWTFQSATQNRVNTQNYEETASLAPLDELQIIYSNMSWQNM